MKGLTVETDYLEGTHKHFYTVIHEKVVELYPNENRLTSHFTSCKSHVHYAVKHIVQSNTWDVKWFG